MTLDRSYQAVMERRNEIMKRALGIDYTNLLQSTARL